MCGRKNYRLQDIQLSKINRGSAPNPGSVARGAPAPLRSLAARIRSPRRSAMRHEADNFSKTVDSRTERGFQGPPRGLARLNVAPKGYGEYRARTGDLLVANQALSQLS